ncbi:uncharacterized protein Ecym_1273 [Eremothecium cymbalariae DBVPG|uniref:Uncharacterized protein n=1 Tax=Eremothecium cymbalariae (strain CBS 270.75 / DBVPG 7215 / KCTC 17166 / NRRL Y-17582) TaxID=931890 RepID=G8JN50_ERECY|nr:hypothetical protein Ecym_1273 [Eremothecium cymbalariae DBVPG\
MDTTTTMSNTLQDIKEEEDAEYMQDDGGCAAVSSGVVGSVGVSQLPHSPTSQASSYGTELMLDDAMQEAEAGDRGEGISDGGSGKRELGLGLGISNEQEGFEERRGMAGVTGDSVGGSHSSVLLLSQMLRKRPSQLQMTGEEALLPPLPDIDIGASHMFGAPVETEVVDLSDLKESLILDNTERSTMHVNSGSLIDVPHLSMPLPLHMNGFRNGFSSDDLVTEPLAADPDDSFDLSKALEMSNHEHSSSSSNQATSSSDVENITGVSTSNPMSPLVSAPMASLKRKISFTFNANSSSNLEGTPGLSSTSVVPQQQDSSLIKTSTKSSSNNSRSNSFSGGRTSRSSSNAAYNVLFPTLNATIESSAEQVHHQVIQETSKRSLRKYSAGSHNGSSVSILNNSSSSSSNNNILSVAGCHTGNNYNASTAVGDAIRKSHSWLSAKKRSSGNLAGSYNTDVAKGYGTSLSSPLVSKKTPLLRRASSVILRKAYPKRKGSVGLSSSVPSSPQADQLREQSSLSSPCGYEDFTTANPLKNRIKPSLSAILSPASSDHENDYLGSIPAYAPTLIHSGSVLTPATSPILSVTSPISSYPPSFGSKVKRGFSRIIGGGQSKPIASQTIESSITPVPSAYSTFQDTVSGSYRTSPVDSVFTTDELHSIGKSSIDRQGYLRSPDSAIASQSSSLRHVSTKRELLSSVTNNCINPRRNPSNKNQNSQNGSVLLTGSIGQNFNLPKSNSSSSVCAQNSATSATSESSIDLDSSGQFSKSEVEVNVDVNALTKNLPTITITENFGAKNTTPIQTQSNILLDKAYISAVNVPSLSKAKSNNNKTRKIPLKEYIHILMSQQMIEDQRFAVLENSFNTSGWCSNDDMLNLRQKRVIINRKWAERISYYQNKLEA